MNAVWGYIIQDFADFGDGYVIPEPARAIFMAFDEGEYERGDGLDPVQTYTMPLLEALLADL